MKRHLRDCGGCTECCTALEVDLPWGSIGVGTKCKHQTDVGCSYHKLRPQVCQDYHCAWRCRLWGLGDDQRPDRWGVLVDTDGHGTAAVRILRHNALKGVPEGMVRDMKRSGVERIVVLGPDGEVVGELG